VRRAYNENVVDGEVKKQFPLGSGTLGLICMKMNEATSMPRNLLYPGFFAMTLGIALITTSCTRFTPPLVSIAHFSPEVKQSFQVSTNRAIIYGRFATGRDFAFGNELAIRLCSEDSKRVYLIRCRETNSVYAIAVEPGRYRIAGFLATFIDHRPAGRRVFSDTPFFDVRSNSATYIGDINGYAKIGPMVQIWGVKEILDRFSDTTEEYRTKYKNLASVPVFSAFEQTSNATNASKSVTAKHEL
jgi:hypothetical protein